MDSVLLIFGFFAFIWVAMDGGALTVKRSPKLAVWMCGLVFPIWFIWAYIEFMFTDIE